MGSRPAAAPARLRLAPRTGFALSLDDDRAVLRGGYGIFLNQWAYSVQTAFARNLPFFFTKQVDVPSDVRVAVVSDARHPRRAIRPAPSARRSWTTTTRSSTRRRGAAACSTSSRPSTMVEVDLHGVVDARRGQRDRPQCSRARAPDRSRRGGRFRSSASIRSIRFDGRSIYHARDLQRRAPAARQLRVQRQLHAVDVEGRRVELRARPSRKPNVPQNVRNIFSDTGEWALSSFDHRHLFAASATYQLPSRCRRSRGCGAWRLARQRRLPRAVRRAVHGQPGRRSQANIGAGPAQRPDQIRDPNLPAGRANARSAGSTPARSRCRRRSPSAARRATA